MPSAARTRNAALARDESTSADVQTASALAPECPRAAATLAGGEERDVEAAQAKGAEGGSSTEPFDVEHVFVEDDPRQWSEGRKNAVLATIAFTAIGGNITGSIYFPAIESLQNDLNTTDDLVAASVSLFIAGQGVFPMVWSAISEVSGRKYCYISSMVIYVVGTVVCSQAPSMGVFLAGRVLQSLGGSAALSLGGGTLADMYDVHERGTKFGIYYACPLLGPAIGPIIGGGVTAASNCFLLAYGGVCFLLALWLPDTFRKERSLAWRKARDRAHIHVRVDPEVARTAGQRAAEEGAVTAAASEKLLREARLSGFSPLVEARTALSGRSGDVQVKISLRDLNPFAAVGDIVRQPANLLVLLYSGIIFASQYAINFTSTRTFAADSWDYAPIGVGLVLLSFGMGNVLGSVCGGRYSDYVLARLRAKNGGVPEPEMRIRSTYPVLAVLPCLYVVYGWLVYYEVHVAGPVVVLFFLGAAIMVIYSSTLAYIVDANPGRSTSTMACNSLFRGLLACAASQAAEPILDKVGNGCFYSGWGILLLLFSAALILVVLRAGAWRAAHRAKEQQRLDARAEKRGWDECGRERERSERGT
ncbi:hypothetical protein JCM10449v2_006898 [Rhodotorula kratochvilovae]